MSIERTKTIIGVLMESSIYFELTLKERLSLIKHILSCSHLSG